MFAGGDEQGPGRVVAEVGESPEGFSGLVYEGGSDLGGGESAGLFAEGWEEWGWGVAGEMRVGVGEIGYKGGVSGGGGA